MLFVLSPYLSADRTTVLTNDPIQSAYSQMVDKLKAKPELVKHIIPDDFNVACRRPTPGNGYLEALAGPKSHVFTNNIGGITKKGVIDSATGIEVSIYNPSTNVTQGVT